MQDQNRARRRITWALGLAVVATCAALNWALNTVEKRIDLTEDRRYTLPEPLLRIAEKLDRDEPVKVTVYLSESLPQVVAHLAPCLQTRLSEIARAANGGFEYEFVDPKEDVDLVQRLEKEDQIKAYPIPDVRNGTQTFGNYFLSLVFRRGDKGKEVAHLAELGYDLAKPETTLAGLSPFFAARLVKLGADGSAAVGVVSEKKLPPAQPNQPNPEPTDFLGAVRESLGKRIKVQDVVLKNGLEVPKNVSALLLHRPENLTELEIFQIDQHLMRGGSVVVLYDNWSSFDLDRGAAWQQAFASLNFSLRELKPGIADWLRHYGFVVSPGVVHDRSNFTTTLMNRMPNGMIGQQTLSLPGVVTVRAFDADKRPTGQLDETEPAVTGLTLLPFVLPAPMQLDAEAAFAGRHPGAKLSAFLRTSPEAWTVADVKETLPMANVQPPPREQWGSYVLAGRATGPLRSYFAGRPAPKREGAPEPVAAQVLEQATAEKPGQLWVLADSDFALDIWPRAMASLNGVGLAQALAKSQAMLMNVIDVAGLGGGLVDLRRSKLLDRSVDAERVKEDRSTILWTNIWMMPAVLVAFGLLRWWWRSASTFVPSPRQPVTVGGSATKAAPADASASPPPSGEASPAAPAADGGAHG